VRELIRQNRERERCARCRWLVFYMTHDDRIDMWCARHR
jgi:formamidopyrimidine-DNA glycosylase